MNFGKAIELLRRVIKLQEKDGTEKEYLLNCKYQMNIAK